MPKHFTAVRNEKIDRLLLELEREIVAFSFELAEPAGIGRGKQAVVNIYATTVQVAARLLRDMHVAMMVPCFSKEIEDSRGGSE